MQRFEDWPTRMHAAINAMRREPFAYGVGDCCQFVARVILAMTGEDLRGKFPSYQSKNDARRILAEHGGLAGLVDAAGLRRIDAAFAQRGDVALTVGDHLAIVDSDGWVAHGNMGLVRGPMIDVVCVWATR